MHFTDRPCAARPYTSYRIKGPYGYIMIGATGVADAMREARRSTDNPDRRALEVWEDGQYVSVP
jgi:hypothetical protein